MGKKRWAAEVNDEQFEWLKGMAEAAQKAGGTEDFTGSVVIQELIEAARSEDPGVLVRRLVRTFLQRRVESLQAHLDTLSGPKDGRKRSKPQDDDKFETEAAGRK